MGLLFQPRANTLARVSLFGGLLALGGSIWILTLINGSPFVTRANLSVAQPVPFSHQVHAGNLGMDCRYCHTSVATSSFAGMPSTQVCMTCHTAVLKDSPALAPLRQSWQTNTPLEWNKVYNLPGFVYFDHSIHVQKGVGCASCHGQVDQMPLMRKAEPVTMGFCLGCHRAPQEFIRPRDQVFNMAYRPPANQAELGRQLVQQYHILSVQQLTSCSTCHR